MVVQREFVQHVVSLREEGRDRVYGESVGDEEIAIGIEEGELPWREP